jgi:nucleotide-binding universal stress UspA family protein
MITLKTIVASTDFSENADHALQYASELGKKFGAKILLVHVVAYPIYPVSYEITVDVATLRNELETAAKKMIEERAAKLRTAGVEVECVVEVGTAFVEIIRTARHRGADLIIISTHGWSGMKHLLLGSTAERVVRKAPCPVLTVKPKEHEFVVP